MFWLKNKSSERNVEVRREVPPSPRYPPQAHQFVRLEDWLIAWVAYRLKEAAGTARVYEINGTRCFGLIGSIGLDSAVAEDGTFLIHLGLDDHACWQPATAQERLWLIICTQRRLHPEFSVLLPLRPQAAYDCSDCKGTGFVYHNTVICQTCSALGWLVNES